MFKFFLFAFLTLFVSSVSVQADPAEVQASMSRLFANGFTNGHSEKYGFSRPGSSVISMELFLSISKGRKLGKMQNYDWLDGNIFYSVVFLSEEYPNSCVFALLFDEDVTEEDYRKGGSIWKIEHDSIYERYAGKTFYFVSRNMFFKINENDDPPTVFIDIDMDGDGIIQDGEGRYMWF